MKYINILIILIALGLTACTSIQVKPLNLSKPINYVCIEINEKVIVQDFLEVVRNGFDRHGISTKVYSRIPPKSCEVILTYTALRSWDFTPYLSHAELWLRNQEGRQIAYAEYHLQAGGGLMLTKWASVKSKMDPVIDKLLGGYNK